RRPARMRRGQLRHAADAHDRGPTPPAVRLRAGAGPGRLAALDGLPEAEPRHQDERREADRSRMTPRSARSGPFPFCATGGAAGEMMSSFGIRERRERNDPLGPRDPKEGRSPMTTVNVRYIVDDIDAAVSFYTTHLGFTLISRVAPAFADVARGDLRLL